MKEYQRFLTPNFEPFDPLELAKETEKIVTRAGSGGLERKYTGIYSAPVYRGIATAYAVGCPLRCVFCWTNWSRDFPEMFGEFLNPRQVAQRLSKAAEEGITNPRWKAFKNIKVNKLRISGCEPTLGKEHLLAVLELVSALKYPLFILETNGIILGSDKDYVERLSKFKEKLYVRVSFKAATPEGFTERTGAIGKFYELPFKALKNLLDGEIYAKAAAMTDQRTMPAEERKLLIEMLGEIDPEIKRNPYELEEEQIDAYGTTIDRLKA
jgi:uncharacterized Fe-S cluster-containing radical SAM superfamily protein